MPALRENRECTVTGVRAHPNYKWSTAKTAGKTVSPGVFPRFGEGDFFFGGLGDFLPAGPCPAIAPIESSAMQKPTRSVGSEIHGPGTGAIRRVA